MTPRSITLIGRNNTAPSHMTDAQREQAQGRFERSDKLWYRVAFVVSGSVIWAAVIAGILS